MGSWLRIIATRISRRVSYVHSSERSNGSSCSPCVLREINAVQYTYLLDPFQTAVRMGLHRHPILVFEEHPNMVNTHWLTDLPVMSCKKHKVGPTPGEF
jgi:hypothetical protein